MRIDVTLAHRDIDDELRTLYNRMRCPGDVLCGLPVFATACPRFAFRYREANGEFHVYVEDTFQNQLAGCTIFARVPEISRTADRFVRSPHSRYASAYRRMGIGSAVYRWALDAGMCLISGPRQSIGAHSLWLSLAQSHELLFAHVQEKKLECLRQIDSTLFGQLDFRMVLLGAGWDQSRFAAQCAASRREPMRKGVHGTGRPREA